MRYFKKLFRLKIVFHFLNLIKLTITIFIGYMIKKNKKYEEIWLISERNNEARDNGYHLFKYIRTYHSDINVYYVIDKKAIDKKKIISLGNVIGFGSLKHFLLYVLSSKLISTHINGPLPDSFLCPYFKRILPVQKKVVFLQHGVIKDYHAPLSYEKAGLDLFICGAEPEYHYVNRTFGYTNNEIRYLGLSRFDNLHDGVTKRQILLMPTFRMWLATDNLKKSSKDRKKFLESEYYKVYQSFLNNPEISALLDKNNFKLVFYPHYETQGYLDLFSANSKDISIANSKEYDVQELLKDSAVLITDYSSVFFDFSYMKKPIVYYHFDYNQFRKGHYKKGYFDYEKDGFGSIVKTEKEIFSELNKIIENNFNMEETYKRKVDCFFPLNDKENTKRNFEAIYDL
ncbi:CDP-glycerol glycerophosphotransferase family protein [Peribacillus butanolivorans]|uniref:CDP-glycerol glycerophosphotransferase family protein n=1 Tax=Peribacillus butanolivorans TaxID=421767 RepID=UPI00367287F1